MLISDKLLNSSVSIELNALLNNGIISFCVVKAFFHFTVELILPFNCILEECGVYIRTPSTFAESYLVHGKWSILV